MDSSNKFYSDYRETELKEEIMLEKSTLIFALVWIGLGLFGLIFDPDKKLIIMSQFIAGFVMLFVYTWFKFKNK